MSIGQVTHAPKGMLRLGPIETAIGCGVGIEPTATPLPTTPPDLTPLVALEAAILPALLRPPCVVAFSGGRDSSAVLASATALARREGLDSPIPLTHRFPRWNEAEESDWQEMVVRHLKLPDWQIQCFDGELDRLGPFAQSMIRRHGLIAPAGGEQLVALAARARGGSLLTGIDGDGLFNGGSYARLRGLPSHLWSARPRDLLTLAKLAGPRSLRHRRNLGALTTDIGWLRPEAAELLRHASAAEATDEPLLWCDRVRWFARLRHGLVDEQASRFLGAAEDVAVIQPLLDPSFVAAVGIAGGRAGYGSRSSAMTAIFGGLLPGKVLTRESKATFTRAFSGDHTRTFARQWDGSGVPSDLVDPEVLRNVWLQELPDARSSLLLQAAWAAQLPAGERKQPLNCTV